MLKNTKVLARFCQVFPGLQGIWLVHVVELMSGQYTASKAPRSSKSRETFSQVFGLFATGVLPER